VGPKKRRSEVEEMNNFNSFLTPEEAKAKGDGRSLKEIKALAKSKGKCCVCGEDAWKYAGQGMCFTCTTGESDASEDYELIEG
jgi:hypothetical protein